MLSVKQELLAALADALEQLSPGAGAKAAFESPKVAAHGDFACTAAMQLAKPLRLNPRQLAETLRTACWPCRLTSAGFRTSTSPAPASSTSGSSLRPSSRS
jgi:arginyl-tRNA synthetase